MKNNYRVLFVLAIFTLTSSTFAQSYIDTTFGEKGYVKSSGSPTHVSHIKYFNNKFVVMGGIGINGSAYPAIARYNINGSLDRSFGTQGSVQFTNIGPSNTCVMFSLLDLEISPNNNILFSTYYTIFDGSLFAKSPYYIREIGPNGETNSNFIKYEQSTNESDYYCQFTNIFPFDSKVLYFIGNIITKPYPDREHALSIVKYNSLTNKPDTTFGEKGVVKTLILAIDHYSSVVTPDKKIIVGGYSKDANGNIGYILGKFNLNGSIDSSFGNKGYRFIKISASMSSLKKLEITTEGKIYVIGNNNSSSFIVFRLNSDGSNDDSFGQFGHEIYSFPYPLDFKNSLLLKNGNLLLTGINLQPSLGELNYFLMINSNSLIDKNFGEQGRINLPNFHPVCFAEQNDGKIIIGGSGPYLMVRLNPKSNTIDVKDEQELLPTFNLAQNYPNPFNPTTTINFSLPEVSDVTLKVYDVLGKEVASLINERKEAGDHTINFQAENFSAGMYIYKLTAGSNTVSKKMMLVK